VWHGGSAKQCIWLGPSGYFCGCEQRIANTDSDSNGHGESNSDSDRNSDGEPISDTNTNVNAYSYCNCHPHPDSYFDAQSDAHAKIWAISEASSDSGASSIEVFAIAKICTDR
jgi:hypothetical protein